MNENILKEISELEPSSLIILYELILKDHNTSYFFHSGENGYNQKIKYLNNEYFFIPVKTDGFDFSENSLPRPTLTFDNTDSFFGLKTRFFKDFIGYSIKRTKTFVKFLHGDNFPNNINPYGTGTEISFPTEKFIINQKTIENDNIIQFELTSPLEKEAAFLPNRKIVFNTCQWRYRSNIGCGYSGPPISDSVGNDLTALYNNGTITEFNMETTYNRGQAVKISAQPNSQQVDLVFVCTTDGTVGVHPNTDKNKWTMDSCPKNISGCRQRFKEINNNGTTIKEETNGLPFGGFPGSWEY